jgi:hypothetical protein
VAGASALRPARLGGKGGCAIGVDALQGFQGGNGHGNAVALGTKIGEEFCGVHLVLGKE